ncbi:MAG TPA: hypothetical protein VGL95_05800, partial [Acetobacteraceae bacterium]
MRVLLSVGFSLECGADRLERGLMGRVEYVLQRAAGGAVAITHQLQDLNRGNQRGRGEVLERFDIGNPHSF